MFDQINSAWLNKRHFQNRKKSVQIPNFLKVMYFFRAYVYYYHLSLLSKDPNYYNNLQLHTIDNTYYKKYKFSLLNVYASIINSKQNKSIHY